MFTYVQGSTGLVQQNKNKVEFGPSYIINTLYYRYTYLEEFARLPNLARVGLLIGFTCEEGETEKRPGGMEGMDGGHFTGNRRVAGGGGARGGGIREASV